MINPQSSKDLQNLANEITRSIKIDENGNIMVNADRINPSALTVQKRSLQIKKTEEAKKSEDNKRYEKKKVIFKTTKTFISKKYLMIISFIERASNINNFIQAHQGGN